MFFILLLFYFIIRDEFEFDDLKYCVLISVLRSTFEIFIFFINGSKFIMLLNQLEKLRHVICN